MDRKKVGIIVLIAALLVLGFWMSKKAFQGKKVKQIDLTQQQDTATPRNTGPVSPISGISCDNWNKRAISVMQPADVQARPAAGFSQADMVFELPAFTNSNTRLMGVYLCDLPKEVGAIRSARHDYIALAAGLNSVFIHWGGSHFALGLLDKKIIDHIDCLTYEGKYCSRWNWKNDPKMRMEDSGHVTSEEMVQGMKDLGFSNEGKFSGYPHQDEASIDQRPNGGRLRVVFPKPYDVAYDYDKNSNTYLRSWDGIADTDRNNGQRVAPKNVVVMFAKSEQIKLADESSYVSQGLMDPWTLVPENEKQGLDYGGVGRYNNVQLGDPWFDTIDSGDAYFYMNGQQIHGSWKKNKSKIDSKLFFYDNSGQEIKFVPGQIWVDILEPDQAMEWKPAA